MNLAQASERVGLRRAFEKYFGKSSTVLRCALAPGRVNLIGEHTDYNGGLVLPLAIARHTAVVFRPTAEKTVRVYASDLNPSDHAPEDSFSVRGPIAKHTRPRLRWANYVRGVAASLQRKGIALHGGEILLHADLPRGAGLSSSASLEVGFALALLALAGRKLDPQSTAFAAQWAEHNYAGVRCGIMDQSVVARGQAGHALMLDCLKLSVRHVPLRLKGWAFALFDTGVRHELGASEYNKRRAECERAAKILGCGTLRECGFEALLKRGKQLTPGEHARARHIWGENIRVAQFAELLARGDAEGLGRLLIQSHLSLQHDYQVSCAELDFVANRLAAPESKALHGACVGARMTGGGFGGAVVALIRPQKFAALRADLERPYSKRFKLKLGGAMLIEPAAGAKVLPL